MKIRIQHQKLIYRLQNEDLDFLKQNNYCEESLQIGSEQLLFSLQSKKIDKEFFLFKNNTIQMMIPENVLKEWLHSEIIEIEFLIGSTKVIVEKDLKEFRRYAER